ncbi:MAG: DUF6159 family protein [Phycisphaerae bacterium]|nr:DUF6159 family protein [Phycisphaerae bacterium]
MAGRITNGLNLARASWEVIKLDKEMLLFPVLSGLACLVVLASFAVPLIGSDYLQTITEEEQAAQNPLLWVLLFCFYFANYFVIVFFNVGLVSCAMIRFDGGNPTVMDGLRAAFARLPQIMSWALLSATVGVILKAIESRSSKAGKIASGLLGMAWGISTYFVVPVLAVERVGPFEAIKRSLSILRKTWGEALVSNISISLIVFLAILVCCVPAVLGGLATASYNTPAYLIGGAAVTIVLIILVSLISSVLNVVIVAALYHYASTGNSPRGFDDGALQQAFYRD